MEEEGRFTTQDGMALFERRWLPEGETRAHVVLIHGYGEHCGRYGYVAEVFNAAGIAVHTYDQRGFGKSPGKRGRVDDIDVLVTDADSFAGHVKERFDGKPWFMMGHSMGGMVLAAYAQTHETDAAGYVFSSPFLAMGDDVPKWLIGLSGIVAAIAPWLPVGKVDSSGISRDPEAVKAADEDPLSYHGRVTAHTGAQFNTAIGRIASAPASIDKPVLFFYGTDDRVIGHGGTVALHERAVSEDKTLRAYEGGYHELWNDIVKEEVMADVRDWITARI